MFAMSPLGFSATFYNASVISILPIISKRLKKKV